MRKIIATLGLILGISNVMLSQVTSVNNLLKGELADIVESAYLIDAQDDLGNSGMIYFVIKKEVFLQKVIRSYKDSLLSIYKPNLYFEGCVPRVYPACKTGRRFVNHNYVNGVEQVNTNTSNKLNIAIHDKVNAVEDKGVTIWFHCDWHKRADITKYDLRINIDADFNLEATDTIISKITIAANTRFNLSKSYAGFCIEAITEEIAFRNLTFNINRNFNFDCSFLELPYNSKISKLIINSNDKYVFMYIKI